MTEVKNSAGAVRRTAMKLALVAVGMFGFGYLLVPLYDLACPALGINGKTGRGEAVATTVDATRTITIEFTGHATTGLPWEFRPMTKRIDVHPGEMVLVKYYVRNTTDQRLIGQAVPSVAPNRAAPYFKKIECFCFTRQELKPGESREMPVQFTLLPDVAPDVTTITLAYSFFNVDKVSAQKYGGDSAPDAAHDARTHGAAGGNS